MPIEQGALFDDRYWILGRLGHGVTCTVWEALDIQTQDTVAVKVYYPTQFCRETAWNEQFILESVHTSSSHAGKRHVIELDRTFRWEKSSIHILRPIGKNLYHLMYHAYETQARLPLEQVKTIVRETLLALDCLHRHQVVHADLKPENMLWSDWRVYLIDFGMASWRFDPHPGVIGTREYRAPEVLLRLRYDTGVDMWALGCIVFELLTGDYLFNPAREFTWQGSEEEQHLAGIVETLGELPFHMVEGHEWFTVEGEFISNPYIRYRPLEERLYEQYGWVAPDLQELLSFLLPLLSCDPQWRATTRSCLDHPWLR
jgi:serine/threonine protein kinase